MKILYLTFYFEPDLCAGSFRNTPLAKELARQSLEHQIEVKVITTQPNRYSTFKKEAAEIEKRDNLIIKRISISEHRSGFADQIVSFRSYYSQVLQEIENESFDLVFASSSRLFTAYLGYKIAKKNNIPLYLDIRDLFTDTMEDMLQIPLIKKPFLLYLKYLEKKIFNYAQHINLISGGFNPHVSKYNIKNISNYSHGIDFKFVNCVSDKKFNPEAQIITYAGNIGEGQGLHKIVPRAAELLGDNYQFRIIGDGGTKDKLLEAIKEKKLTNVILESPVSREKLINAYSESDYMFIHLNDYEAFKKVMPSKIFELGAINRPIIAGVAGFARKFMESNLENIILFDPGNVNEMVDKIRSYKYQTLSRSVFIDNFDRENINRKMASSILSLIA